VCSAKLRSQLVDASHAARTVREALKPLDLSLKGMDVRHVLFFPLLNDSARILAKLNAEPFPGAYV
jgi:hypothetical protein